MDPRVSTQPSHVNHSRNNGLRASCVVPIEERLGERACQVGGNGAGRVLRKGEREDTFIYVLCA